MRDTIPPHQHTAHLAPGGANVTHPRSFLLSRKVAALQALGVSVTQRLPLVVAATDGSRAYLRTKALRMAHVLPPESYATKAEALAATDALAAADALATAAQALAKAASSTAAAAPAVAAETFVNPRDGKVHTWALGRASVEAAVAAVARGELVAVTDDEARDTHLRASTRSLTLLLIAPFSLRPPPSLSHTHTHAHTRARSPARTRVI
jgi:hypothetical protein